MLLATILALSSAALHAGWNLRVKRSADRLSGTAAQFACGSIVVLPIFVIAGPPTGIVLLYLGLSSMVHVVYLTALIRSYESGDFSMAYPLARGGGALVAALGGIALLGDDMNLLAVIAIAVVAGGLMSLVRPSTPARAIGWGALTAAFIGTYTLLDSAGAREAGGFSYGSAICITAGLSFNLAVFAVGRGDGVVAAFREDARGHVIAGICASGAYLLVLVAVNHAPVGYVATLRESSVVLGAAAGWWLLKERLALPRVASSAVVALGMVILIAARP
ncbi:MAG: EamA family transporter [Dehalococcoidia bacterium]